MLALTLGIGLTASMFSIAYSVLARGMPFEGPDELMAVTRTPVGSSGSIRWASFLDFRDWQEAQTTFSHLGAWTAGGRDLVDDQERAARVGVTMLSPSMFPLLGEAAALGRTLTPAEIGPDARVAVLSDRIWKNRYAADPGVLGRALQLNGETFTVVGVMPPGFAFPDDQDVFIPLPFDAATVRRNGGNVRVLGRLPRATPQALAVAELEGIADRLVRAYPDTNQPVRIHLVPLVRTFISDDEVRLLWTLVAASFFVLIIACANVANLLTARALDRSGDVAIATALGASRRRILAELLTESLVLALVGGAFGVAVAWTFLDWFEASLGGRMPPWMSFEIDGPILGFILGASVLSALAAGLTPALRSASVPVRELLQDESRGASSRSLGRLSQAMVVLTMALAYPLLVCSALLISSFQETTGEMGFDRDNVLVVQLSLPGRRYTDATMRHAFRDDFIAWAEGQPGVTAAGWSNWIPGAFAGRWQFAQEGIEYLRNEDYPAARLAYLRPGFLEMLDVPAVRGRLFDDRDRTGPPAALVNEAFANRFFAGQDPLGRRIRITGDEEAPWHTVVGVVPDLRMNGSDQDTPEGFYLPSPPIDVGFGHFFLRADTDPQTLAPVIRTHLAEIDPELPIHRMDTLEARIEEFFWFVAIIGSTFTTFGAAALFLASVGLYGVMAHSVSRRTREMGVRMAMGASRGAVLRLILTGGMAQVGLGLAAGGIVAWSGSRLITEALFGVRPGDPATMVEVAVVLVGAAFVAMIVPALRATRRAPVEALRAE